MNAAVSDAVARTRQRDLRWEAERQRLAVSAGLARLRVGGRRARPGRVAAVVVGRAAGAVAALARPPSNRPVMPASAVNASRKPQPRLAARFERDVLPHLDRLYGLALLLTVDSDAAEDLVEATFTAAHASFHRLPAGADPKAWLYQILLSTYRARLRPEPPPAAATPADPAEAVPPPGSGPAPIEALRRLPEANVKHAVRQLPVEVRVVVYLADVEGYTYAEIAAITATPTPTVTARLHHGRHQLRHRLQTHAKTATLVPR